MRKDGFTLIEFIIGMVAGVCIALVAMFLIMPLDNWVFTQARRAGMAEGEIAVMRVVKEIGRVKAPTAVDVFASDEFRFVDIDNNTIDLKKTGTDFLRNTDALARNVTDLTFTYLDAAGNPATVGDNIRVVGVELTFTVGAQTIRLKSASRIRNQI